MLTALAAVLITMPLFYFSTPWVAAPMLVLTFVVIRASQFRFWLATERDVGTYEALREREHMLHTYRDAIPPGIGMAMGAPPQARLWFLGAALVFAVYLWRYFFPTVIPDNVSPDSVFFVLVGLGALGVWRQSPAVGMSRLLGFAIYTIMFIPGIALLSGLSPFSR